MSTVESRDRLYDDADGWLADPLYKLWAPLDERLLARLMSPLTRCPHDARINAKMQQLLSKYTVVHREMLDLLYQSNHRDFIFLDPVPLPDPAGPPQ
jgi:hypothetical protein